METYKHNYYCSLKRLSLVMTICISIFLRLLLQLCAYRQTGVGRNQKTSTEIYTSLKDQLPPNTLAAGFGRGTGQCGEKKKRARVSELSRACFQDHERELHQSFYLGHTGLDREGDGFSSNQPTCNSCHPIVANMMKYLLIIVSTNVLAFCKHLLPASIWNSRRMFWHSASICSRQVF